MVADKLFTTPATVSRYLAGKIPVPRSAVELFKSVLASEKPEALEAGGRPASPELARVQSQVREIHERDAGAFRTVRAMVDGVHRSLPPVPSVQLSRKDQAKLTPEQQARVVEAARAGVAAAASSGQKPKAVSTTGNKFSPRLPARHDSGDQQSPPDQVPAKRALG